MNICTTIGIAVLSAALMFGAEFSYAKPGKGGGDNGGGGSTNPKDSALEFLRSQMPPGGLIDSFIEDNQDWAYTYDNAMGAIAFLEAGDIASAQSILDTFATIGPEPSGGFLHRYRASDGGPASGLLRAGHNGYLIQAMNLYYRQTGDARYNAIAVGIADYMLSLQDPTDGGIVGHATVTWKSTENNLGALSGIYNLGIVQNLPEYLDRADQIALFLTTFCWDGTRFLTGKNDPTIATDTQALGAMVLGANYTNGAYWIQDHTLATYTSGRGKNSINIEGFDMNIDRDTIWTEGTLQQSIAFLVAADPALASYYLGQTEVLAHSSGAFYQASNQGTTGFGEFFYHWQAAGPSIWYVLASLQVNPLRLLP